MWLLLCLLLLSTVGAGASAWADVDFDATDDGGTTGKALSEFITNGQGTMMAWYTPTAIGPGTACWDGRRLVGDEGVYTSLASRSAGYCAYNNDGGGDIRAQFHTIDVPSLLVWVHGGGNFALHHNDIVGTASASGNTTTMTSFVAVGKGAFGAAPSGRIHDIKTFNVALSVQMIESYYLSRSTLIAGTPHPTAHWDFMCPDGASADAVEMRDRSGERRHLTLNDGATNGTMLCRGATLLTNPYGVH